MPGLSPAAGPRLPAIDALRGIAILAMVVYHFGWDLSINGLASFDAVNDPGWRLFARLIAGTFLLLVGVNLVLAARGGFRRDAFLRRLAIVVAAAALVSLGTFLAYPDAFVFFGILHAIALFSVLALPFLAAPVWVTAAAALFFLAAGPWLRGSVFDAGPLVILGLAENPPPSVDFVPVFPWFGVVLAGVVAGHMIVRYLPAGGIWRPSGPLGRGLIRAGRWSLAIYLIHQPVLIGLILAYVTVFGPNEDALAERFVRDYRTSCTAGGHDDITCEAYAACVVSALRAEKLIGPAYRNALTPADIDRWRDIQQGCVPLSPPGLTRLAW